MKAKTMVLTTMLLLTATLAVSGNASATHANCGDPVQDAYDYGWCRGGDAWDHCYNEAGGACQVYQETVVTLYALVLAGISAGESISESTLGFVDRACDSFVKCPSDDTIQVQPAG